MEKINAFKAWNRTFNKFDNSDSILIFNNTILNLFNSFKEQCRSFTKHEKLKFHLLKSILRKLKKYFNKFCEFGSLLS